MIIQQYNEVVVCLGSRGLLSDRHQPRTRNYEMSAHKKKLTYNVGIYIVVIVVPSLRKIVVQNFMNI